MRHLTLLRIADCRSKSPIRRVPWPPKAPGNRPVLPHVALVGAETWFASTTAYFCTIHGHFQSFSKGSGSRMHRRPAARSQRATSGKRGIPCPAASTSLPRSRYLGSWPTTGQIGESPTTRPSGFRDRRVTGVTRSGRQTSHNQTSGQSPGRRARRSAVAQDHLRHGDSHELSESDQLPARRQLESYARVRGKIEQVVRASSRHDASGPGSGDRGAENPNPTPLQGVSWGIPARRRLSGASAGPVL
jgi:hypothetical protein